MKPDGVGNILWKFGTRREKQIAYANRFRIHRRPVVKRSFKRHSRVRVK